LSFSVTTQSFICLFIYLFIAWMHVKAFSNIMTPWVSRHKHPPVSKLGTLHAVHKVNIVSKQ
jgi:hypothetical protein